MVLINLITDSYGFDCLTLFINAVLALINFITVLNVMKSNPWLTSYQLFVK